jgi:hypothetical protein
LVAPPLWPGPRLSIATGRLVTDATSGFWVFDTEALTLLADRHPSDYPEPELILLLSRTRLRFVEVPVHMRERMAGQTSLTLPHGDRARAPPAPSHRRAASAVHARGNERACRSPPILISLGMLYG